MWGRCGLIGNTGFVGGTLMRSLPFDRTYNSRTIEQIDGESFDTLICAGAPATMWAANANPQADAANLERLAQAIERSSVRRLVLISTIAVLDDMSAGYTESTARYETQMAYGRNRRALEERVLDHPGALVLRLPALFGAGLKKNFIYDLMNSIPSFIKPDKFEEVMGRLSETERLLASQLFSFDEQLRMHKLDRAALDACGHREPLEQAFARTGFTARNFTNSASRFQYYNLACLQRDIEAGLMSGIRTLNVSSEPMGADELHQELMGTPFINVGPPVVREDMRTEHAGTLNRQGPYLHRRAETLAGLKAFVERKGVV